MPSPAAPKIPFRVRSFPLGKWRVAWLGDVAFRNRFQSFSQPMVRVTLAPLDSCDPAQFTEATVPVGAIMATPVDSVWADGVEVTPPEVSDLFTASVAIDSDCMTPIKAGESESRILGTPSFCLPFGQHSFHREHTDSWCLHGKVGDQVIVIPALEIARFYFGSSSTLLKRLLCGQFDEAKLCSDHFRDGSRGRVSLTLAPDMSGRSAADIARILYDPAAREAATLLSKSLTQATASGRRAYPRAKLPFRGRSTLIVLGRTISVKGEPARFVVSQILSCSHAFPFASLEYVCHSRQRKAPAAKPEAEDGSATRMQVRKVSVAGHTLTNEEPKKSGAPKSVHLKSTPRFPDLSCKYVSRVTPERRDVFMVRPTEGPQNVGTGDGRSAGTSGRVDYGILLGNATEPGEAMRSPSPKWQPYFDFLTVVTKQPWVVGLTFLPLDSRAVKRHFCELPVLVDEDGVVLDGTLMPKEPQDGAGRPGAKRRVSIARLDTTEGNALLIALEPRKKTFVPSPTVFVHPLPPDAPLNESALLSLVGEAFAHEGGTATRSLAEVRLHSPLTAGDLAATLKLLRQLAHETPSDNYRDSFWLSWRAYLEDAAASLKCGGCRPVPLSSDSEQVVVEAMRRLCAVTGERWYPIEDQSSLDLTIAFCGEIRLGTHSLLALACGGRGKLLHLVGVFYAMVESKTLGSELQTASVGLGPFDSARVAQVLSDAMASHAEPRHETNAASTWLAMPEWEAGSEPRTLTRWFVASTEAVEQAYRESTPAHHRWVRWSPPTATGNCE